MEGHGFSRAIKAAREDGFSLLPNELKNRTSVAKATPLA